MLMRDFETERCPPKIYSGYTFSVCILCSFLSHEETCLETLALDQGVPAILTDVLGSLACVGGLTWHCHANLCRYAWGFYYRQIINAISIRNIWQWITFLKFLETYNWEKTVNSSPTLKSLQCNYLMFYFQYCNEESLEERNSLANYIKWIGSIMYTRDPRVIAGVFVNLCWWSRYIGRVMREESIKRNRTLKIALQKLRLNLPSLFSLFLIL